MLKLTKGVRMAGLDIKMRPVLLAAGMIWDLEGQDLIVTSALDGEHSPGSLHYYGLAIDFAVRAFDDDVKRNITFKLREELGRAYDVINEGDHIHVEWDPR